MQLFGFLQFLQAATFQATWPKLWIKAATFPSYGTNKGALCFFFFFLCDRIESDNHFLFQMSVYQTYVEQMESFTFKGFLLFLLVST